MLRVEQDDPARFVVERNAHARAACVESKLEPDAGAEQARQRGSLRLEVLVDRDPELIGARGEALRLLLYIFGRDEAVRLLRAG